MPSGNTGLLLLRAGKLLELLPTDEAEDRLVDFVAEFNDRNAEVPAIYIAPHGSLYVAKERAHG